MQLHEVRACGRNSKSPRPEPPWGSGLRVLGLLGLIGLRGFKIAGFGV